MVLQDTYFSTLHVERRWARARVFTYSFNTHVSIPMTWSTAPCPSTEIETDAGAARLPHALPSFRMRGAQSSVITERRITCHHKQARGTASIISHFHSFISFPPKLLTTTNPEAGHSMPPPPIMAGSYSTWDRYFATHLVAKQSKQSVSTDSV